MVIEAQLKRDQFVRLAVLRHFQRTSFYIYSIGCALLTAYGLVFGPLALLLAAWVPFLLYIFVGVLGAWRESRLPDRPYFLKTRYEFKPQGVTVSTAQGESDLGWDKIRDWRVLVDCYVLELIWGSILAIPQSDVPQHQREKLETLLSERVTRG